MPNGCKYICPCRHGLCHSICRSGTIQDPELGHHSSTTSNTITSDFTNSTLVCPPWLRLLTALKPSGYMNGAYDIYTAAGSSGSHQNNKLDHLTLFKAMEANYQSDGGKEGVEWYEDKSKGEDDSHFVNFSLLSHITVRLRDSLGVHT